MMPLLLSLGLLYSLALGAGRLSAAIGTPRVTGYLVVGLAAGPSLAHLGLPVLITPEQIHALIPLHDVILGLIVFTIGGSFSLEAVRKIGAKRFRISAVEIGITAILVGLGTFGTGASPLTAAFLAVMSITTAPAATQMVMREYQSEGSLTDTILPLIGINNLVAIIGFIFLKNSALSATASVLTTMIQIAGPFLLGTFIGIAIAIMDQRLTRSVERQILVLAAIAIIAGLASILDMSAMLMTMVAGVVAVNASPYGRRILEELTAIDYPLYVLFFIMAGADLHLESLGHMGFVGIAYVVMRFAGKYSGCWLGARMAGASPTIRTWLGPSMLAQAGLAIGLAETLARGWPGSGETVQTIILAAVVVFEGVGPLLTRVSLVNAGEVTVLNLLVQRSRVGVGEGLQHVLSQFGSALGISPASGGKKAAGLRVGHIMRRNVEVISNRAPFDEVLKTLGHSRYDRLPVVNDQEELVGVIKYSDIADTLFDPGLRHLIVADDIASDTYLKLTPEDTLEKAIAELKNYPHDAYLLVVERNNPKKLIGVVRHNDVLSIHVQSTAHRGADEAAIETGDGGQADVGGDIDSDSRIEQYPPDG
jgi:Kef-type K+ transport system membrane component KefB/CBS domain-containing protein